MSKTRELELRFNAPQFEAFNALAPRRSIFLGFGRGIGKSFFLRQYWWLKVAEWDGKKRPGATNGQRGVRITALMPTLVAFKDVHWAAIEQELTGNGPWSWLGAKLDNQRGQVKFPGGSWVKPFPAAAHNSKAARGMRSDILSGDEVDDIDAEVYDAVAVPILSEPFSLGIELNSGTPTRGRHGLFWRMLESGKLGRKLREGELSESDALEMPIAQSVKAVFDELDPKDWPEHLPRDPELAALEVLRGFYSFHATYKDAPETVSPVAVARAKATTPPATFAREWLADCDAGEGLVYPFEEKFHVQTPPPLGAFQEFHVGCDHGWVDPGVLLLCGVQGHGEDAVLWILDERYETECPNDVWDRRAKEWSFAKFWCDPSRPDRINTFRSMGLSIGDTDNNIAGGISRVADLLFIRTRADGQRYARLYVAPHCVNTIREFGLYRRMKNSDGSFSESPKDKDNHALDCARYVSVGRFGRGVNRRSETSGR